MTGPLRQKTGLVDTHCHLQDEAFREDRDETLRRALETLDWLVVVGDALASSEAAAALVRDGVYAAAGFHPYHAGDLDSESIARLRSLAAREGVAAIGEIGLDYYRYCGTPKDVQRTAFVQQLLLARQLDMPVIIHNREANDDVERIFDEHRNALPEGVMHCFSGDAAFAKRCVDRGFYISFAGNATFPKAGDLREAANAVPADRLLVETDSPYLAPQPARGKRCEPAYVAYTAERLAAERGEAFEAFAEQTSANARALFLGGGAKAGGTFSA